MRISSRIRRIGIKLSLYTALSVCSLIPIHVVAAATYTWNLDHPGSWNLPSSWSPTGIPNGNDDEAIFGRLATAPLEIVTNSNVTAKLVEFDNENRHILVGTGRLNLTSNSVNDYPKIAVRLGSHQFQIPIDLRTESQFDISLGATLELNDPLNLHGHTLHKTGAGKLIINSNVPTDGGGTLVVRRGSLLGPGMVSGTLKAGDATIAPGTGIGTLNVLGNYVQDSKSVLSVEIDSADQHDLLAIAGAAHFNGELAIHVSENFNPNPGESFTIATFASSLGDFDFVSGLNTANTAPLAVVSEPTKVRLVAASTDHWTGPSGNWMVMDNWLSGHLPSTATIAQLSNGEDVQITGPVPDVLSINIGKGSLYVKSEGFVNVLADMNVKPTASLHVDGERTQLITNNLIVEGSFYLTNMGLAEVTNKLTVGTNGTLAVDGNNPLKIHGQLTNYNPATKTLTGGNFDLAGSLQIPNIQILENRANLMFSNVIPGLHQRSPIVDAAGRDVLADLHTNGKEGQIQLGNYDLTVSGEFTNEGLMTIRDQGTFIANNTYKQVDGKTTLENGQMYAAGVEIQGGLFEGTGIVTADSLTNAGEILPGRSLSTGTLMINGAYVQNATGKLDIELDGPQQTNHDQLAAQTAVLAGQLDLSLLDNFVAPVNTSFDIITTVGGVSGQFDSVYFPDAPQNMAFKLDYSGSNVQVHFVPPTVLGYNDSLGGGTWSQQNIWLGEIPDTGSDVTITNSTTIPQQLNIDINAFAHAVTISGNTEVMTVVLPDGVHLSSTHQTRIEDQGILSVEGGTLNNGGDLVIDGVQLAQLSQTGGAVNVGGNLKLAESGGRGIYDLNGGTLDLKGGAIEFGPGTALFNFNGGRLANANTITSSLIQNGGVLAPGNSPGTTTILGDYTINDGTLEIELGGLNPGESDKVEVTGSANLSGTLDVSMIESDSLSTGDTIEILSAVEGVDGEFDTLTTDGSLIVPLYSDQAVFLCVSPLGDLDVDCDVDLDDVDDFALALSDLAAYENTVQDFTSPFSLGDFDADFDLDFDDIPGFLDILPEPISIAQFMMLVPEPSSLVMMLLGLTSLWTRRSCQKRFPDDS